MLNKTFLFASALLVVVTSTAGTGVAQSFSRGQMEDLLTELQSLSRQPAGSGPDYRVVWLLNEINENVSTVQSIQSFRSWDRDDELVSELIPYAAGEFSTLRIPATRILANVVDNTNVCLVIAHLRDGGEVTVDGRYNLLQVVRQVSNYAWIDTGVWIDRFVHSSLLTVAETPDLQRTELLLRQIQVILESRSIGINDRLSDLSPRNFATCVDLLREEEPVTVKSSEEFDFSVADFNPADIQEELFSPRRREFAEYFVELHATSSPIDRHTLVEGLLDSVIAPDADGRRRYRVNLYIALIFSRLPRDSVTDAGLQRLDALRDYAEMSDPTFRQNVENALRQQE